MLGADQLCSTVLTRAHLASPLGLFDSFLFPHPKRLSGVVLPLGSKSLRKDIRNGSKQRAMDGTVLWYWVIFIFLHRLSANHLSIARAIKTIRGD